ncbi:hypothetical protein JD844_000043 [Phrynosoma platyrhinos]|uniref:Uncharacterized protein n=1 Tax=Phrynosoma platyrhinos TaxID=52577 RepID=A0ABQ7SQ57_PHRPL|nr:hypothetical protein JD844_000043 [Phrynosoma platyrhinos]
MPTPVAWGCWERQLVEEEGDCRPTDPQGTWEQRGLNASETKWTLKILGGPVESARVLHIFIGLFIFFFVSQLK